MAEYFVDVDEYLYVCVEYDVNTSDLALFWMSDKFCSRKVYGSDHR